MKTKNILIVLMIAISLVGTAYANEDANLNLGTAVSYTGYNKTNQTGGYVYNSLISSQKLWYINPNLYDATVANGSVTVSYDPSNKVIINVNMTNLTIPNQYNYPNINYGRIPGGTKNTNQTPQFPIYVNNGGTLNTTVNYSLSYNTIKGNVAYDIFYSNSSLSTDHYAEVMIWFWRDTQNPSGSKIGTTNFNVILNGVPTSLPFDIWLNNTLNIVSYRINDSNMIQSGEIQMDLMDVTNDAISRTSITTPLWMDFIQFGSEFYSASQTQNYTLTINKFSVNLTTSTQKLYNYETTNAWTNNVIDTNVTNDLSSHNSVIGFLYDTFIDNFFNGWSATSATENNGIVNITSGGSISRSLSINDNFNASVYMQTIQQGAGTTDVPQFRYLYNSSSNGSTVFIRTTNITKNEVVYNGISNFTNGGLFDHNNSNLIKINTYGSRTDLYVNNIYVSNITTNNLTLLKNSYNLNVDIFSSNAISNIRNLRYWINNTGSRQFIGSTASIGTFVNRTRIITTSDGTTDIYVRTNGISAWNLIQSSVSNNTWYDFSSIIKSNSIDFKVVLNGNESDTPIFTSLEWDEFTNTITQTPIGNKNSDIGKLLQFTVNATDLNGDTFTYATDATKGSLNPITGIFSWTPTISESGTYTWTFQSQNIYGGIASETITVTINPYSPINAQGYNTEEGSNLWVTSSALLYLAAIIGILGVIIIMLLGFKNGTMDIMQLLVCVIVVAALVIIFILIPIIGSLSEQAFH